MQNKHLPVHLSKGKALLMLGIVLFIYVLDSIPGGLIFDFSVYNNFIKPLMWFGIGGLVWILPRARTKAPLKLAVNLCWWAFNFAAIYIIASVIAAFFDGFGKSPYDHSFIGTIINVVTIGSALVGREAVRYYAVNNLTKEENFFIFIIIALIMTMSSFVVERFIKLEGMEDIVKFVAQFLVPEFLNNLLATYLAFLGGWLPAFIYMGILKTFHWISPVLPNLQWITAALVGIMCPAFSLSALQGIYMKDAKILKNSEKEKEGLAGWIVTSFISIGIIWFSIGVFPLYPSVIATGSMEPLIKPGDMIIVEKILKMEDVDQLKAGDVIQFQRGNILISHRIVEIVEEEKVKRFRTKGDNNSVPDGILVKPEDLRGRIKYVVPKIGWPTLIIKSEDDVQPEDVMF